MSRTTFTIILSILTLAATGCSKKPQNIETISNTDKPVAEIPNIDNIPFEERKPFKYTVTTDIETEDGDDVIVTVYADSLDHKYEVKYDLDCKGDGEYEYTGLTKLSFCHYAPGSGTHQIWVRGEIPAICLCSLSCANSSFRSVSKINSQSVISVDEWGDVAWKSMVGFAAFCNNLNQLPDDVPILYYVKDLSSMFEKAASFNQPLEHWDVSGVTNMEMMLSNAKSFNQPLEKWNVSNVTNMSWMFNDES